MIRYAISFFFLFALLLGCAIGEPVKNRDLEFARQDQELERKKYQTFVGSKEREAIDQQIIEHDHKWYLDFSSQEQQNPKTPQNEAERIKKINELIDKQLQGAQQPLQKE